MNDVRNLKIALVSVFVLGAIFAGYNAYKYSELNNKVADFSAQVTEAKTEAEAKTLVSGFVADTATTSGALTTFAGKDGGNKKNGECSFKLFGICFSRYQNQPDGNGGGQQPTGGNWDPCFGDYSFGCNGGDPNYWINMNNAGNGSGAGSAGAAAGSGTGSGTPTRNDDVREYCGPAASDC